MQLTSLLTPKDATLVLVDTQPGLAFAVESSPRETLRQNIIALAKTAGVFGLPIVVTTSASKRFSGPIFPELQAALGAISPIERTSMNAWESAEVVAAVERTTRKTIVLAGLLTEACVAFTGISALAAGYRVLVVADACGASSPTAQDISIRLLEKQGAELRTWLQLLLELQRDWTRAETYKGASDIVKAHAGAYGIGLSYAKAMIPAP
jgi:nicotinamidase-related amidase